MYSDWAMRKWGRARLIVKNPNPAPIMYVRQTMPIIRALLGVSGAVTIIKLSGRYNTAMP